MGDDWGGLHCDQPWDANGSVVELHLHLWRVLGVRLQELAQCTPPASRRCDRARKGVAPLRRVLWLRLALTHQGRAAQLGQPDIASAAELSSAPRDYTCPRRRICRNWRMARWHSHAC